MTSRRRDSRRAPLDAPRGLDAARLLAAARLGYGRAAVEGSGVYLLGPDREQYLDAASGPSAPLGYGHPALVAAVREAASSGHASSPLLADPAAAAVTARLERLRPAGLVPLGLFGTAPAALEAALEVARLLTGRDPVVVEPLPSTSLAPREPGETWRLARRAHDAGVLVLSDERGLGVGRLGTLVAAQAAGLEADLALLTGLAGPFGPATALLGTPEAAERLGRADGLERLVAAGLRRGEGWVPAIASAAAAAALDLLADGRLLERAARAGVAFGEALQRVDWAESEGLVEARGAGLAWAVECADPSVAERLVRALALDRILVAPPPPGGRVVRLLPPLVIEDRELDFVASSIAHAAEEL